jgi:hypothetical protein
LDSEAVAGKELYVPIDSTSCNLSLGAGPRREWGEKYGVIDDNSSPGFCLVPSLVLDAKNGHCYGLGDILVHNRPKVAGGNPKLNQQRRSQRARLALSEKESGAWSIVSRATAVQLRRAKRVTFIIDQGGDIYESLAQIRYQTQRDFIVRIKCNERAKTAHSGRYAYLEQQLKGTPVRQTRTVYIKSLLHVSKTHARIIRRKARWAKLDIKFIRLELPPPSDYAADRRLLDEPLWVICVKERQSTVPKGEPPIEWRLLTTWHIEEVQTAWQAVAAYQQRWDIEQLFRILKKQGFDLEASQLNHPEKIKKLAVMALNASARALQLVAARDGEQFIPITELFDEKECRVLSRMNERLSADTPAVTNPHNPASLAWAAWVVARAGSWSGYQSQRKPGPIIMTRGLRKLETLCSYYEFFDDA